MKMDKGKLHIQIFQLTIIDLLTCMQTVMTLENPTNIHQYTFFDLFTKIDSYEINDSAVIVIDMICIQIKKFSRYQ